MFSRTGRRAGVLVLFLVLAVSVVACDSDSDAAVVTPQAAPAATATTDGAPPASLPDNPQEHLSSQVAQLPVSDLSEQEIVDLMLMREEEKLARDVYLVLGEIWGVRTFSNIAAAEETHMAVVLALIERYDLEDPVGSNGPGVLTDPALQEMYDGLVARGEESLAAALTVGASIEDLDIADLESAIAATDNEDIAFVYENLQRGSRNHMRAFSRQLERNDVTFVPTYLSVEEYQAIVAAPTEHGNG